MSNDNLLPCPFCGSEPLMQEHPPHTHSGFLKEAGIPDHPGSWTIECPTDGCCGMLNSTYEEAITAWNRRAANTATAPSQPEREAFEAWASDHGLFPRAVERNADGYRLMQTHQSWIAWQAACRAMKQAA